MHPLINRGRRALAAIGTFLLAISALHAQKPAGVAPPRGGEIQRTAHGRPDLQGTWDFAQLTPFERPDTLADKSSFGGDREAEEFAKQRIEATHKDRRDGGAEADVARAYNDFWWDFGTRIAKQTSLVIDPPDGRVPPLTPAAVAASARRVDGFGSHEERPLSERCIVGFNSGPPMVPSAYNNYVQIVQTGDYVVIHNEMIHSARLVDMKRRTHLSKAIHLLTGDSIGRWEADVLVVDTTNFLKAGAFRNASPDMHLVERFSLIDPNTLRYEFTVDDPATWTRPWTASIPMIRSSDHIFEYACHESNYGLENVLRGARVVDQRRTKP